MQLYSQEIKAYHIRALWGAAAGPQFYLIFLCEVVLSWDYGCCQIIIIFGMLILFETAAGYALFRADKPKKLEKVENLQKYMNDIDGLRDLVTLEDFYKFKSTADAFKCISKLMKGKIPKSLSKFLTKNVVDREVEEVIAIADKRLGKTLTEELGVKCKQNESIDELMRVIRFNIGGLLNLEDEQDYKMMTLGVAHGLSRYKLKFSAEKVDIMIIQAVSLLDDLDKEINNYIMRLKEWYGWHFPQMTKVVADNLIYTKVVKAMGMRKHAADHDFSGILPEDIEKDLKDAAEISMGTEISETDEKYIVALCDQILELVDYRSNLSEYLKNRMQALAPNLTAVVGELVGARLISHAGSLVNLAKCPASTVQILGAEKALFKAIKTKHNTPKYGIIYQAQLVNSTQSKFKGKISRALAAKCSLCVRCDALGQSQNAEIGGQSKQYLQKRLQYLESNEGLKQTRKPNAGRVQGAGREQYGQRTEMLKRPHTGEDEEGPRKRFAR